MRFYEATRFLFPRHYERRILAICFVAIHMPLIGCIVLLSWRNDWDMSLFGVLLAATLLGTIGGVFAISALLMPIRRATVMLQAVQKGGRVGAVPLGGDDLVGKLLQGVAQAANETARRIEQLKDAAERDLLTGLRNRRGFLDTVAPILGEHGSSMIAMLDLDHFKAVNDDHGHDRGDQFLTDFADYLTASLRRSDVSARWGGEEFIILFPGTSAPQAKEVLHRLQFAMQQSEAFTIEDKIITFSCGLARVGGYAELAEATRRADKSLYAAKEGGRNLILTAG